MLAVYKGPIFQYQSSPVDTILGQFHLPLRVTTKLPKTDILRPVFCTIFMIRRLIFSVKKTHKDYNASCWELK
jgi:hypothetical protein